MRAKGTTTVDELAALIRRQQAALREAGQYDIAARAHVVISAEGSITLSYQQRREPTASTPEVDRAISLDPVFERTPSGGQR